VRRRRAFVLLGAVVVVAAIVASMELIRARGGDVEYFTQPVGQGDISNVVTATGTVQALVTVDVGSQVSGKIDSLYADYNSDVKQGQVLARIDSRPFKAQLANATANLSASEAHVRTAQADVANQRANLVAARANVDSARAARDVASVDLQRATTLLQRGIETQSDFDTAKADDEEAVAKFNQAQAALEQTTAEVASAEADLTQAQAQVEQAKAAVQTAKLNLDYTTISSPVDGVVISRNVDVGQTVAASLQAPLLFVIANDLTRMQVNASVDEADIGQLSEQEPVTFFVDAYPRDIFHGHISEIRLSPQTVQNVVTYSVIIDVDNPQLKLRPGMTANVSIQVAQRKDVLKIPNAALRYRPTGTAAGPARASSDGGQGGFEEGGRGHTPVVRSGAAGGEEQQVGTSGTKAGAGQPTARQSARQAGPEEESADLLAPGQHWNPEDKIHFPPLPPPRVRTATVWVLDRDGKAVPRQVRIGITDGVSTELVSGDLHRGDRLIIADTSEVGAQSTPAGRPGGRMFRF
jgi:HlyD family secretion protein